VPKYLLFLVALSWTGIVTYFCLVQSNDLPVVEIPNIDKYIHTFFHLGFTFFWFLFFCKKLKSESIFKPLLISVLLSIGFGLTIELAQEIFTTTRHADILDVTANFVGAMLAVFVAIICNKYNILKIVVKN